MKRRPLVGHSGCRIELIDRGGALVVRKTSKSPSYNQRLFQQCLKQMRYANTVFQTPRVQRWDYENGLFTFEMDYVRGVSCHEYLRLLELTRVREIADLFVDCLVPRPLTFCSPGAAVREKIASLEQRIAPKTELVEAAFARLHGYSWRVWSPADCHGDLTLENIICSQNRFYLIDFLDSFADSWLIDVAKLFQDLETHWSYRFEPPDHNVRLRCHLLKTMISHRILAMENGVALLMTIYHLLLLNLLRIIPYITSEQTRLIIDRAVAKVLIRVAELLKEHDYEHLDSPLRWKIDAISEHEAEVVAYAPGWKVDG
jgi:hypothetical protein